MHTSFSTSISPSRLRHKSTLETLDTLVACFSLSWFRSVRYSVDKQDRSGNPSEGTRECFWDDRSDNCNMMWALTSTSHYRCSLGGMMIGWCGQQGSKHTQSWQVGPVCSRWRKRKLRRLRWLGHPPEAIRLGKIIYAVLLTKTEGKAFSALFISQQGEPELKRGDFCARSTRGHLVHGWETWCEKWYAREINGWPM